MSVLLFAENAQGTFKKATFEAATYAYDLAQAMGTTLSAVSVGQVSEEALASLGKYGVSNIYDVRDEKFNAFVNTAYAAAIANVAKKIDAKAVVMTQSYNGRAVAPRVAVKLRATPISGVTSMVDPADGFKALRLSYSGKGVQSFRTDNDKVVLTVKGNSYQITENPVTAEVISADFSASEENFDAIAKEIIKASEGISLTEADTVVSAGRGMKGPENWGIIEEMAELLGAATACSKPTADMDWRPHHEHVGQTGIQIAPNLYIAIGISGAIQHLAGVSSSKTIVVINKDPEAPFFKVADYGIVGDLFEVVPKLNAAIRAAKAAV